VPVTLTVTAAGLTVSPTTLSFSYQSGGTAPAAQTISVAGTGLSYTVAAAGGSWLSATPASGSTPGSVSVSVNPAGLAAGTFNGTVTITSAGAANSPQTVAVTLTVTAASPSLTVSPTTLSFSYQSGGAAPAAKTISVAGTGLSYTVAAAGGSWLSATPASGSAPDSVSVSVNPAGMAAGTFNGTVTIRAGGESGSRQTVAVTLTVTASQTLSLQVSPATLSFAYTRGGTTPATQSMSVASSGATLTFTAAASGGSWLSATPASGSTPGTIRVAVNPGEMSVGTYHGSIAITAAGASNSPQTVAVTLVVSSSTSTSSTLLLSTRSLSFSGGGEHNSQSSSVQVTSSAAPLTFSAAASGGTWLSVSPAGGTTPAALSVSASRSGLASGTYSGVITVTAGTQGASIAVTLTVGSSSDDNLLATPIVTDSAQSGLGAAQWIPGAGAPVPGSEGGDNRGLLLVKTRRAEPGARIDHAAGIAVSEMGFDLRGDCSAGSPQFRIVTEDDLEHMVGGCNAASLQPSPADGWTRWRFDPSDAAQASPRMTPGQRVKSISLVLNGECTGPVVVDNISINGKPVNK
jgi:hypothetical protein